MDEEKRVKINKKLLNDTISEKKQEKHFCRGNWGIRIHISTLF